MDEQQVGLVVSVNYDKLKELYEFWEKNNDKARKENKSTFDELKEGAEKFIKTASVAAAGAAIGDFARTVLAPINTTFSGATEQAKRYRDYVTDVAVASERNWEKVGDRLKSLG